MRRIVSISISEEYSKLLAWLNTAMLRYDAPGFQNIEMEP